MSEYSPPTPPCGCKRLPDGQTELQVVRSQMRHLEAEFDKTRSMLCTASMFVPASMSLPDSVRMLVVRIGVLESDLAAIRHIVSRFEGYR
jgi:hypothetical protein